MGTILEKGNFIKIQVDNEDDIPEVLFRDPDTRLRVLESNENNSCHFRGHDGLLLLTGDFFYGYLVFTIYNHTGIEYNDDDSEEVLKIPVIEPSDLNVNLETFKKIYETFQSFSGEYGDPFIPMLKKGNVYTLYDFYAES